MERLETSLENSKISFMSALSKMDKSKCIEIWTNLLTSGLYKIPELYELILVPSLNEIATHEHPQTIPVWEEHIRCGIVRTALELTYPYVLSQKIQAEEPPLCKALVLCMEEEYHEVGARMVSDYLTLLNFEVFFIGANTPSKEIFDSVKELSPQLVVISISNFYHLYKIQNLINEIKATLRNSPKVVLGGYAIDHTPEAHRLVSPDYFARFFEDFVKIKEGLL